MKNKLEGLGLFFLLPVVAVPDSSASILHSTIACVSDVSLVNPENICPPGVECAF